MIFDRGVQSQIGSVNESGTRQKVSLVPRSKLGTAHLDSSGVFESATPRSIQNRERTGVSHKVSKLTPLPTQATLLTLH